MTLRQDLHGLIQPIINKTTIWEDQNGTRPALPYATLKVKSIRYVNQDYNESPDDDGDMRTLGDREFTLSINYYAQKTDDTIEILQRVVDRIRTLSVSDKFNAKGFSAFDTSAVNDVSFLMDSVKIEQRATVDVFIRYKSRLTDNVGLIDTADITGSDNDEDEYKIIVPFG